jgi:hypothetical protein
MYIWKLLYMFRVLLPPIIRSAYNCIYSIWYFSHRYCYLPISWKSWNWFECAVGGVHHSSTCILPTEYIYTLLVLRNLTPIFPVAFRLDFRSWPPLTGFAITLIGRIILGRTPSDYQSHAETSTWQHVSLIRDRRPCPRRNSNPKSQQPSGRRRTP